MKILEELYQLRQMVEDSDLECWKVSHHRHNNPKLASNAKNAMLDKIDETIAMVNDELYTDAYDKLLHDIKPKLTGLKEDEEGVIFGNVKFKNPWFECEEGQQLFEGQCNAVLYGLNNIHKEEPVPR